jgi:hypothetical protein
MIRVVHPGSGSRIRILTFYPSRIPTRNTGGNIALSFAGRDGPQASGNILINNEKVVARYTDRKFHLIKNVFKRFMLATMIVLKFLLQQTNQYLMVGVFLSLWFRKRKIV